jgi:hypothetical protein
LVALEDLHDATIVFIEQVFIRRKIEIYNWRLQLFFSCRW